MTFIEQNSASGKTQEPVATVKVKPLEWLEPCRQNNGCWTAETVFGTYSAVNEGGWYVTLDEHPWGQGFEWSAPDMQMGFVDAAKAAQADYERRIFSALEPSALSKEREALERLAGMEAFTNSFTPNRNAPEWKELEARIDYARAVLKDEAAL